jgi:uncharacterized RDD family membrane protein YckC
MTQANAQGTPPPQPGEWFFALDNQQRGPVGIEDIRFMLHAGTLYANSLVWTPGMPQWAAAATVPELADVFNPIDAPDAPDAIGGPRELQYGLTPSHYKTSAIGEFATFWQRFVASFIDGIVVSAVTQPLSAIIGLAVRDGAAFRHAGEAALGMQFAIGQCIGWLYFALMVTSSKQGTLGMMAMGLVVTDLEGKPITFARATGRHFAAILSEMTCFIGYLMMLWTQKRQTLHDIIAGTLILQRRK